MANEFDQYQQNAQQTDKYKEGETPKRLAMPFLGLIEDAGELARIYKEVVHSNNEVQAGQNAELEEKLGDILWFLTNIAEKAGLELKEIARKNIDLTRDRWLSKAAIDAGPLYDEFDYPREQQLPRKITIRFRELLAASKEAKDSKLLMFVLDADGNEIPLGDRLNDNSYEDDGYRYHDVLHLSYYAILGWSPVIRALLKKKRKKNPKVDEVEDGARAILLEEALTAYIFQMANTPQVGLFEGRNEVDTKILKTIRAVTKNLEVRDKTLRQWELAILKGYEIFRQIKTHKGGAVSIDLNARMITYSPPKEEVASS